MWKERVCIFCSFGKVEVVKDFIFECEAFKDNRESYAYVMGYSSWDNLFSDGLVEMMGEFIMMLHRKGSNTLTR